MHVVYLAAYGLGKGCRGAGLRVHDCVFDLELRIVGSPASEGASATTELRISRSTPAPFAGDPEMLRPWFSMRSRVVADFLTLEAYDSELSINRSRILG